MARSSVDRPPTRILAFAYACEPGRGSEPGAGWSWVQMLASLGETWVITRARNRPLIENEVANRGLQTVRFVYVDGPRENMSRTPDESATKSDYILWQLSAFRAARRLVRVERFDFAWHLTFSNGWIGSVASLLGLPFIYGPIGGGAAPPWRLSPTLGLKGTMYEIARAVARGTGRRVNPLARASWHRASLVLVQNNETKEWLPRRHRAKAQVFPHVALETLPSARPPYPGPVMLFVGRLLPLKGVALALQALQSLDGWQLVVCGDGPDLQRLKGIALRLEVKDRVDFRGWMDRADVLEEMGKASVFVFPSLHDEAGWVVVEAMAAGLPVVCLRVGGPPILAGPEFAVGPARPSVTAANLAERILAAAATDRGLVRERAEHFLIDERTRSLKAVLYRHGIAMDNPRTASVL